MNTPTTPSVRHRRRPHSGPRGHALRACRALQAGIRLAIASLAATAAHADCVDGGRERSPQEQHYAEQLAAAMAAALPAAPAPLALERAPQVVVQPPCKDTPPGSISALVGADYAASLHYADRVRLTLRANFAYPAAGDIVMGTLPRQAVGFKLHNLVIRVDGHKAAYVESVRQALDRARLQALIDQPLPASPAPAAWVVAAPGGTTPAASASAQGNVTTAGAGPAPGSPPPPRPAPAAVEQAKDAVNKLRGLLGR